MTFATSNKMVVKHGLKVIQLLSLKIDIKDEVQFHRVITRLLEIGVLTPEQGIESMKSGYIQALRLPSAQEQYAGQREQGMYNPLVGGIPMIQSAEGEENIKLKEEQIEIQKESNDIKLKKKNLHPIKLLRVRATNGTTQVPGLQQKSMALKIFKKQYMQ